MPRSEYWRFFEKIDHAHARCRSCSKTIKTCGNTTNLKLHTTKMHAKLLRLNEGAEKSPKKVCRSSPDDTFKLPLIKSFNSSAALQVDVGSDSESDKSDTSGLSGPQTYDALTSTFRNIAECVTDTYADDGRLSNAILYMICKDSQPVEIVENEGFLNLLKVAAPSYRVPSRTEFRGMLECKFEVIRNYFMLKIQEADCLCLTAHIWSDTMPSRSFLGVTVQFLDGDRIEVATLGVAELSESQTGEYISTILLAICNRWKINTTKILALVADDAGGNIARGVELAFGRKCHVQCFAHMISRVAQKSIEDTAKLPALIAVVRKVVAWFEQSATARDELRKQSDLKLIHDVSTRWSSTFWMIERFLELLPVIQNTINCHAKAPQMPSAKETIALTEVCEILRPMAVATREKPITSSKVIPLMRMINLKISSLRPKQMISEILKSSILTEIDESLLPTEHIPIFAVATLLDPRFKTIHFQDNLACSKAIKTVKGMFVDVEKAYGDHWRRDIPQSENKFDLWADHYTIADVQNNTPTKMETDLPSEFDYYLKSPLLDLKKEPVHAWNHMIGSTYPKLRRIALPYLSCAATSTASEAIFSKAGSTLGPQRNRLKGKLLSKVLFLQSIDKKFWDM